MNYKEAKLEARNRWGEGDHLFNLHLYYAVGPHVGTLIEKSFDDSNWGPAKDPEQVTTPSPEDDGFSEDA